MSVFEEEVSHFLKRVSTFTCCSSLSLLLSHGATISLPISLPISLSQYQQPEWQVFRKTQELKRRTENILLWDLVGKERERGREGRIKQGGKYEQEQWEDALKWRSSVESA